MTPDLLALGIAWNRAWHTYHDAVHQETADLITLNHDDDDWRALVAAETALREGIDELQRQTLSSQKRSTFERSVH